MGQIKAPVLIVGIPRSGTSMTAGAFVECGAWGGELQGPNRFNKRGMFENLRIRSEVVKPFLRKNGWDPTAQKPLPNMKQVHAISDKEVEQFKDEMLSIMIVQGLKENQNWFYKCPKMCLIWPIFHKAFPDAKWVIVRRQAEDIVSSCLRTSFMKAYNKRSGWLKWAAHHESCFEQMIEAKLTVREIWPERMIRGDFTEIQACINDYGFDYNEKKVVNFIDPGLWRGWDSKRREGWQESSQQK